MRNGWSWQAQLQSQRFLSLGSLVSLRCHRWAAHPGRGAPRPPGSGGNQLVSHIFERWVSDGDMGSLACPVYSLLAAAVTKHQRWGTWRGASKYRSLSSPGSGGQKSETKVSQGQEPLGEGASCLFQLLVALGIPWLVTTSP